VEFHFNTILNILGLLMTIVMVLIGTLLNWQNFGLKPRIIHKYRKSTLFLHHLAIVNSDIMLILWGSKVRIFCM